jgi:hypothetical protein
MADEDLRLRCSVEFVKIADQFKGAEEWISYCLWETIEGTRKKPLPFFNDLTEEEMGILRFLRDDLKMWLYWENGWAPVAVEEWRAHAMMRTGKDVIDEIHAIASVT